MAGRARCAVPDCANFARRGFRCCAAHKAVESAGLSLGGGDDEGMAGETFAERADRDVAARKAAAAAAFRERVEGGDYRQLFGGKLGALMGQAATEGGVGDELGALRFVMAKLLAEEEDPIALAKAIARVASVSIQAARAQRAIQGQLAEGLTEAITSILTELDAGVA